MILVFDVGNTDLTIGLFAASELRGHWRVVTDVPRTSDEFGVLLRTLLIASDFNPSVVDGVAIASVVPPVTAPLSAACERYLGVSTPTIIDAKAGLPIRLEVDEPLTVGADRIMNTLAASKLFQKDTIVVDFGTATTFDCITGDGHFIGGVIMPGIRTAADDLIRKTAKLPATELTPPPHVIGKRTEDCIRAGVLWGAVDAVDGIVGRIKAEWPGGGKPKVIATGGLAGLVAPLSNTIESVHPDLTLVGLRFAAQALGLAW